MESSSTALKITEVGFGVNSVRDRSSYMASSLVRGEGKGWTKGMSVLVGSRFAIGTKKNLYE